LFDQRHRRLPRLTRFAAHFLHQAVPIGVTARLRVAGDGTLWWAGDSKGLAIAKMKDGVATDQDFGQFVEDKSGADRGGFGNFKYSKLEIRK
jgi:hypothetical protein